MALDTKVKLSLDANYTSPLDLVSRSAPLSMAKNLSLINGTGAGAADRVWSDQITINASSNSDIDLAGTLTDPFGAALSFARVKLIVITAASGNTNNVVVGGASSTFNTWVTGTSPAVVVRPNGFLVLGCSDATGYVVTATSADVLRLSNSGAGTSVTCDVAIVGCSA
jgi:hypothetical protein